jgi:hypothetical protein
MRALRQVKKVKGGYEVTVKCTGTPMQTRVFGSYQECEVFADDYFFDYLGVQLKSVHHPVGDGVVPEGLNPDSLETMEIEIPMTPEQILRNLDNGYVMTRQQQAEAAAYIRQLQQAVLDEREACAKLCDDLDRKWNQSGVRECAKAIRARGNHDTER